MAPKSGMQVHTQGVFPSKPRIFLTDPSSLELSYRAQGTEEMCGSGSAFPCECGQWRILYGPAQAEKKIRSPTHLLSLASSPT